MQLGQESFVSSQWKIISSFWGKQITSVQAAYEKAKAKLQAAIGDFLGLKLKLIQMQEEIAYLINKADKTGNSSLRQTAMSLQDQVEQLMSSQVKLESKIRLVAGKMAAVEQGKVPPGALGQDPVVTPTVILGVATVALVVAGAVAIHTQKFFTARRLLTDVENKVLTPKEAAALQKGAGFLPSLPDMAPYLIGGVLLIGGFLWFRSRRG